MQSAIKWQKYDSCTFFTLPNQNPVIFLIFFLENVPNILQFQIFIVPLHRNKPRWRNR